MKFSGFMMLASTYGSGAYGSSVYNGAANQVQIGPLTLPVTGPQLLGIVGILCIAVAGGLVSWIHYRRKDRRLAGGSN